MAERLPSPSYSYSTSPPTSPINVDAFSPSNQTTLRAPDTVRIGTSLSAMTSHTKWEQSAPEMSTHPRSTAGEQPIEGDGGRRVARRVKWVTRIYIAISTVVAGWEVYCVVRYTIAIRVFDDDHQRQSYASAFTALSVASLIGLATHVITGFMKLPSRQQTLRQVVLLLSSLSLLIPTLFNLAFVSLWRHRSPTRSTMSLVGRCHWDVDVVWDGRSGQCDPGVSWGAWLAGTLVRFLLTLAASVALHCFSWLQSSYGDGPHLSPRSRPRSHSTVGLVNSQSNRLRRKRPPQSLPLTADSASSSHGHRRTFSSTSNAQHQAASAFTYVPNHLIRPPGVPTPVTSPAMAYSPSHAPILATQAGSPPSKRKATVPDNDDEQRHADVRPDSDSDIAEYYSDVDDGGDLTRFAENFRSLVERVTKETEEGQLTPPQAGPSSFRTPPRNVTAPSVHPTRNTPSPHGSSRRSSLQVGPFETSAETEQMQRDLLNAHQIMLMEQAMRAESYEHVIVLGGAVRRMSTIPSLPDIEREAPWTPTSPSPSVSTSTYATPRELTRSPTASTARTARSMSGRRNPMARHLPDVPGSTSRHSMSSDD
ncbi:hypothetical protein FRB99_008300 [Tulasnella sp. 403]|nr:hypothetical protein FRB99_008300 [Tulasnella sp. 403]